MVATVATNADNSRNHFTGFYEYSACNSKYWEQPEGRQSSDINFIIRAVTRWYSGAQRSLDIGKHTY